MRQLSLIGNIGADAKLTDNGTTCFINISVATEERHKDSTGTWGNLTSWHNCTYWGKPEALRKLVTFLKKGTKVYLQGTMFVDIYNSKPNINVAVTSLEIVSTPKN